MNDEWLMVTGDEWWVIFDNWCVMSNELSFLSDWWWVIDSA